MSKFIKYILSDKPIWKQALIISIPVWVVLFGVAVLLHYEVVPPEPWVYVHAPGSIFWAIAVEACFDGIQVPSRTVWCGLSCVIYYLVILAGVAVWRKVRERLARTES